jgi:hypothetical protein
MIFCTTASYIYYFHLTDGCFYCLFCFARCLIAFDSLFYKLSQVSQTGCVSSELKCSDMGKVNVLVDKMNNKMVSLILIISPYDHFYKLIFERINFSPQNFGRNGFINSTPCPACRRRQLPLDADRQHLRGRMEIRRLPRVRQLRLRPGQGQKPSRHDRHELAILYPGGIRSHDP